MMTIFLEFIEKCIEVFMDDCIVYAESFDYCLLNLFKVLGRCIECNLLLTFDKCHFMANHGIVLGYVISFTGIEVD